jgi:tetratricopeptide (TPR) repeat protein
MVDSRRNFSMKCFLIPVGILLIYSAACCSADDPAEEPSIQKNVDPVHSWEIAGFERSLSLYEEGKPLEAAAALERFSRRFPDINVVYYYLGVIYSENGYSERADEIFKKAKRAISWEGRSAAIEAEILRNPMTSGIMEKTVGLLGEDAHALIYLSRARLHGGEPLLASRSYERAIRVDEKAADLRLWVDIRIGLGTKAFEEDRRVGAFTILEDTADSIRTKIGHEKESIRVLTELGMMEEAADNPEKALRYFLKALEEEKKLYGKNWFHLSDSSRIESLERNFQKTGRFAEAESLKEFRKELKRRREGLYFWDQTLSIGGLTGVLQSAGLLFLAGVCSLAAQFLRKRQDEPPIFEMPHRWTFHRTFRMYVISALCPFLAIYALLIGIQELVPQGDVLAMIAAWVLWLPLLAFGSVILFLLWRNAASPSRPIHKVMNFAQLTMKVLYLTIVIHVFLGWWALLEVAKLVFVCTPPSFEI